MRRRKSSEEEETANSADPKIYELCIPEANTQQHYRSSLQISKILGADWKTLDKGEKTNWAELYDTSRRTLMNAGLSDYRFPQARNGESNPLRARKPENPPRA